MPVPCPRILACLLAALLLPCTGMAAAPQAEPGLMLRPGPWDAEIGACGRRHDHRLLSTLSWFFEGLPAVQQHFREGRLVGPGRPEP